MLLTMCADRRCIDDDPHRFPAYIDQPQYLLRKYCQIDVNHLSPLVIRHSCRSIDAMPALAAKFSRPIARPHRQPFLHLVFLGHHTERFSACRFGNFLRSSLLLNIKINNGNIAPASANAVAVAFPCLCATVTKPFLPSNLIFSIIPQTTSLTNHSDFWPLIF